MTEPVDAAIIGAGVGGACAALALARRGFRVTLIESGGMPRHKVCGEFLSPEILEVFKRLGLLEAVRQAGAVSIDAARIVITSGDSGALPFGSSGLALSRYRLDELLWRAAQREGVECLGCTRVQGIQREGDGFAVHTANEVRRARYVIAAPGRNGRLVRHEQEIEPLPKTQRYMGLKTHFRPTSLQEGEVELHPFPGGYCGLVRVEDGLTNACLLASYEALAGRPLEAFWKWVLGRCPALAARVGGAERVLPWLSTANVSFGRFHPAREGVLFCGDGAGYIHPLTGDGMAMAAQAAELAAATVAAGLRGGLAFDEVAPLYAEAWRRAFRGRLAWGARLHPLLISPGLVGPGMMALGLWPGLARMVIRGTRG